MVERVPGSAFGLPNMSLLPDRDSRSGFRCLPWNTFPARQRFPFLEDESGRQRVQFSQMISFQVYFGHQRS